MRLRSAEYYRDLTPDIDAVDRRYGFDSDEVYYFNADRPRGVVLGLDDRHSKFDPQLAGQIAESAIGEKVADIDVAEAFGTGHVITFVTTASGRKLVVRTNQGLETPELYMGMEQDVFDMHRNAGIPVGNIIASDTSRSDFPNIDYQVMDVLPGIDLKEWTGDKSTYLGFNNQLGRIAAGMHKARGKGFGRWRRESSGEIVGTHDTALSYLNAYLDYHLGIASLFGVTDNRQGAAISDYFKSEKVQDLMSLVEPCFLNHDIADHNIRVDGEKVVAIFDYENGVLFDPVSEIGSAPTWAHQHSDDPATNRRAGMRQGYIDELGYEPEALDERIALYHLRTSIWKLALALKNGKILQKHLDQLTVGLEANEIDI